jgi:hypothetical protein
MKGATGVSHRFRFSIIFSKFARRWDPAKSERVGMTSFQVATRIAARALDLSEIIERVCPESLMWALDSLWDLRLREEVPRNQ